MVFMFITGCSGRNIHPELKNDPLVMVRQWTLSSGALGSANSAVELGSEFSNPVLVENALIFGNQSVGLISLYPKFMRVRWTFPITGGVMSELLVDHGSVYFAGGDGFLYSVNTETGKVNWKYDIHNPGASRPTLAGGRLFITTTDDTLYAFDAGTGKWLWHYRRRSQPFSTILGASAPLVDGNDVIAGLSDGYLVSVNVNDGSLKWERKIHQGSKFTDVDAHPVLDRGIIYVPSYDGALYALKRGSGEVLWRFDAGGSKQVIVEEDSLYLPSTDGFIYRLQKSNAKVIWKFELDKGTPTQLIVTNRHIVVGSSFQYIYTVDKKTGQGLFRYNVGSGSGFYGSPAYDAETARVYFLSGAGNLYSFWIRPGAYKARPHVMTDGYVWNEQK